MFSPDGTLISASAAPHCGAFSIQLTTHEQNITNKQLPYFTFQTTLSLATSYNKFFNSCVVCRCTQTHVHTQTHTRARTHTRTYTHHTHKRARIYACVSIRARVHTHTHAHTHTQTSLKERERERERERVGKVTLARAREAQYLPCYNSLCYSH